MTTTDMTLHPIGDVARRTGLSVSAVRYYSDEGLVEPSGTTDGGHRLYDLAAIARLELIGTLRDLDTGLDRVRSILAGSTSLGDVLAEHLEVVEERAAELQTRRAVLRALVRENGSVERTKLLRRLVTMPDTERAWLVDDFWNEVCEELPEEALRRVERVRPVLPADPTPDQLDAWISLAELLGDERFRAATRAYLHVTYASGPGAEVSARPVQDFVDSAGTELFPRLLAAHRAGLSPEDPHVVGLATRLVEENAAAVGMAADDHLRERMAAGYRQLDTLVLDALQDPDYSATHGRYLELVSVINGEPHPDAALAEAAGGDGLRTVGQWLAAAIDPA